MHDNPFGKWDEEWKRDLAVAVGLALFGGTVMFIVLAALAYLVANVIGQLVSIF